MDNNYFSFEVVIKKLYVIVSRCAIGGKGWRSQMIGEKC